MILIAGLGFELGSKPPLRRKSHSDFEQHLYRGFGSVLFPANWPIEPLEQWFEFAKNSAMVVELAERALG